MLRFTQVDVFAARPFKGNPVAVVHEADELSSEQMALFARWTNLSETTFLLSPQDSCADYRLRIFTPSGELPFAGHPTLGSCHAWLLAGGVAQSDDWVVQECAVGMVRVRRSPRGLAFAAPAMHRTGPLEEPLLKRLTLACGLDPSEVIDHQWVDNGPGWCALRLASARRVLSVVPDFSLLGDSALGLVGPWDGDKNAGFEGGLQPASTFGSNSELRPDFELRAFVPSMGVPEDPVTGSLNASIAQWLIGSGAAPPNYIASQGSVLGRAGLIFITSDSDEVWVGGATDAQISGQVRF